MGARLHDLDAHARPGMQARRIMTVVCLVGALLLPACTSLNSVFSDEKSPTKPPESDVVSADKTDSVGKLYNKALATLKEGDYKKAATQFDEVERQHPYSIWARRAILMSAFCHYQRNDYDNAVVTANRFIKLHPGNRDAAYAYYLIGISYYEQISDVGRDQANTQKALDSLQEVAKRFPGTIYAQDAKRKLLLAKDHLAGKEMEIGRYYLERQAYIAAINRFRRVITKYQTTSHAPEALMRLSEAYMALGVKSEAQTAAAILGHNYPNSQWYRDSYSLLASDGLAPRENKGSWMSRQWRSMSSVAVF